MPIQIDPVYLDNQATTPLDPRVLESMMPYLTTDYGNPHSRSHFWGAIASNALEDSRATIAKAIGAEPEDIIFTSGATESNNLAILGLYRYHKDKKNHIITTQIEHKCIHNACRSVEEDEGGQVTYLPVGTDGLIDLDTLREAITEKTLLVSIIAAHNEIGVVQPIDAIAAICKEKGVFFHTDAAQAVGKIPMDVSKTSIDLMSISGHKIYGPKGIGALYVRRKPKRVRLKPLIFGGGQERGLRAGTMPTPLCVGLAKAITLAVDEMPVEMQRQEKLRNHLWARLSTELKMAELNGSLVHRLPGNLNVSFAGIEGEALLLAMDKKVGLSSGSACNSATLAPSYVLEALHVPTLLAQSSIRISLSRFTTQKDADFAADKIISSVKKLRDMSPVWEMIEDGIDVNSVQWVE